MKRLDVLGLSALALLLSACGGDPPPPEYGPAPQLPELERPVGDHRGQQGVLDRGQLRQQVIELEDEADARVAQAGALGVPEGTIRSRIRRARLQLRKRIADLSASPDRLRSTMTRLDDWAQVVRSCALDPANADDD